MNTNEETRLRNLLLKMADGKQLKPLDILYIEKLSAKKAAENAKIGQEDPRPPRARATAEREQQGARQ